MTDRTQNGAAGGTRDRLVRLLQGRERSVEELASALEITPNAVRSHLNGLERDGLVHSVGERRGLGRPSRTYGLTSEAERRLSRAYVPVLGAILEVLAERRPGDLEEVLREAGRRIAAGIARPPGDLRSRVAAALRVLEDLGGAADLEEVDGKLFIRGHGCPLGRAVAAEPRTCGCMETFLSEFLGAKVWERCQHGDSPQCAFEVRLTGEESTRDASSA